jgi:hypothetical protein
MSTEIEQRKKTEVTETAWTPGGELTVEEWTQAGRRLGQMNRAVGWWVGDWLNYGQSRYGEKYLTASEITGLDPGTLRHYAWVAVTFAPDRRSESVSWSHHYELAGLKPAQQDRWLARLQAEPIARERLRTLLRTVRVNTKTPPTVTPASQSGTTSSRHEPAPDYDPLEEPPKTCPTCGQLIP